MSGSTHALPWRDLVEEEVGKWNEIRLAGDRITYLDAGRPAGRIDIAFDRAPNVARRDLVVVNALGFPYDAVVTLNRRRPPASAPDVVLSPGDSHAVHEGFKRVYYRLHIGDGLRGPRAHQNGIYAAGKQVGAHTRGMFATNPFTFTLPDIPVPIQTANDYWASVLSQPELEYHHASLLRVSTGECFNAGGSRFSRPPALVVPALISNNALEYEIAVGRRSVAAAANVGLIHIGQVLSAWELSRYTRCRLFIATRPDSVVGYRGANQMVPRFDFIAAQAGAVGTPGNPLRSFFCGHSFATAGGDWAWAVLDLGTGLEAATLIWHDGGVGTMDQFSGRVINQSPVAHTVEAYYVFDDADSIGPLQVVSAGLRSESVSLVANTENCGFALPTSSHKPFIRGHTNAIAAAAVNQGEYIASSLGAIAATNRIGAAVALNAGQGTGFVVAAPGSGALVFTNVSGINSGFTRIEAAATEA